jgi:2-keto-4-pentenoate hydratase
MTSAKHQFFAQTRRFIRPAGERPGIHDFADAYAVQKKVFKRYDQVVAWKLGGVNVATRQAFQVDGTYAGPLAADGIMPAQPIMHPNNFGIQCQGELEILVRLGDVQTFNCGELSVDDVITAIAPAIECPASVLAFPEDGVFALIADCCAAGSVVHGEWMPWQAFENTQPNDAVSLFSDSGILAEGVYNNLIDGVAGIVQSFFDLARQYSLPVKAGDLIATGGITPCVALPHGQLITASFTGLGDFSFLVQENIVS